MTITIKKLKLVSRLKLIVLMLLMLFIVDKPAFAAGIISTVAGNGTEGYSGDGGTATSAHLDWPYGVAMDSSGNLYFADYNNSVIRKVNTSGIISTVAGTGTAGYSGDGGAATSAQLNFPGEIAVDGSGTLYIADSRNDVIRMVNTSGIISTVAGNGTYGYSGDGGAATSAKLNGPYGVAVDSSGNIYIADSDNNRIRKVNTSGIISTVAGNGTAGYSGDGGTATSAKLNWPTGVAVNSSGNLFIADNINNLIRKVTGTTISTVAGNGTDGYSGDGGAATSAKLSTPYGIAVDGSGNLYIADTGNNRIREVAGTAISTIAGSGTSYYSGDGGAATSAGLTQPQGITMDSGGNLYIADTQNNCIRKVVPDTTPPTVADGTVTTSGLSTAGVTLNWNRATDDGSIQSALQYLPYRSSSGNIDTVSNIESHGTAIGSYTADISTLNITGLTADTTYYFNIIVKDEAGNKSCYTMKTVTTATKAYTAVASAASSGPTARATDTITLTVKDSVGNTDTSFTGAHNVTVSGYTAAPDGTYGSLNGTALTAVPQTISVTFASGVASFNLALNNASAQTIALTVTGVNTPEANDLLITPVAVATTTVTTLGSGFSRPMGVDVDSSGNIYVADTGNNAIKKMNSSGTTITTLGSGFSLPAGIAVDSNGNIYVTDYNTNAIKKMNSRGTNIVTLGSGFEDPMGVAVDSSGNIYVADYANNAIKKMNSSGNNIVTLGSGFSYPIGVAVDSSGNIYVADTGNNAIKKMNSSGNNIVTLGSGFSNPNGVEVDNSGNIYVADSGNYAIKKMNPSGTNIIAQGSGFSYPDRVAVDSSGNIYVADTGNNAIKSTISTTSTLTYSGNGNTGGTEPASNAYAQGASVTVSGKGTLVKTNYAFAGWNTLANGSGTSYTAGDTLTMGAANVTLNAQWIPTYKVTYNGNTNIGGSVPIDSYTYVQGASVTVSGNTGSLVKAGYAFAGWNTATNGSGTSYVAGAAFAMGTSNVTLYARWQWVSPSITSQPTDQTVTAGQPASFSVVATGDAPFSYQWKKGGTDIGGATSATLIINSAQATDAGSYTCYVSNAVGNVTSNATTLTVIATPVAVTSINVTGAGNASSVQNGSTLQMSAAVLPANATNPSVTWSVTSGTGTATIDSSSGLLTGTGNGTVTVKATANDGSGVTGTLQVTVTAAPVGEPLITSSNTNVTIDHTGMKITYPMYSIDGTDFTQLANNKSVLAAASGYTYEIYEADGTTVATAMEVSNVLKVLQGGNVVETYTFAANIKYGDVNGDGVLNTADLTLLTRYLINSTNYPFVKAYGIKAADINKDNVVNSSDQVLLQRYLMNAQNYPISSPTEFLYNPLN